VIVHSQPSIDEWNELRVALNPIILGGGALLFKPGQRIKLELVYAKWLAGGIMVLRHDQLKSPEDRDVRSRQEKNHPRAVCGLSGG
jgi:hypothetical protein